MTKLQFALLLVPLAYFAVQTWRDVRRKSYVMAVWGVALILMTIMLASLH